MTLRFSPSLPLRYEQGPDAGRAVRLSDELDRRFVPTAPPRFGCQCPAEARYVDIHPMCHLQGSDWLLCYQHMVVFGPGRVCVSSLYCSES